MPPWSQVKRATERDSVLGRGLVGERDPAPSTGIVNADEIIRRRSRADETCGAGHIVGVDQCVIAGIRCVTSSGLSPSPHVHTLLANCPGRDRRVHMNMLFHEPFRHSSCRVNDLPAALLAEYE